MISKLVTALQHFDPDITAEDISDALWLALEIKKAERVPELDVVMPSGSNITSSEEVDEFSPADKANFPFEQPTSEQSASRQSTSVQFTQTSVPQHASSSLYPNFPQRSGGRGTMSFKSPAASALPGSREIARTLRPFKRRVSLPGKFVLNEEATAKRIAEEDIWVPVLDYASVRWLDVALVVDKGVSMTIWHQTIAEFHRLMAHQGAFRDVRLWELDTNDPEMVRLYTGAGAFIHNKQARGELELIDTSGRRLILVVTDCVSKAWHSGSVTDILAKWGRYNPVTLVQLLPQRLWSRTSLGMATRVRLHASSPGAPNRQLHVRQLSNWYSEDEEPQPSIAIPIVTLESRPLAAWARVMARAEELWIPGFELVIPSKEGENQEQNDYDFYKEAIDVPLSAAERLQRFGDNSSDLAWKLAELLAIVPITLPVMRLIQQTMLPESRQVHVAEVFLGGIIEVVSANSTTLDPDYIEYEFVDGVRELLLNTVLPGDSRRVLIEISDFIASKPGHALDFRALLANPLVNDTDGVSINEADRPFAIMAAKALRRFGGAYESLADRLEESSKNKEIVESIPISAPYEIEKQELIQGEVDSEIDHLPYDEPIVKDNDLSSKSENIISPDSTPSLPQGPFEVPQPVRIIKRNVGGALLNRKCICPSCFEDIYIGDCRIVSGLTIGKVLKEAPMGLVRRQVARLNPERLEGPQYALELAHRECPNCKYHLPPNIERVMNITLAIVGDTFSGKSCYIASLIHQIKSDWIHNVTGYAHFRCLTPDIEKMYTREYFEPLFMRKMTLSPTQPAAKSTWEPLIYELVVSPSPNYPTTAINLLIYDASGEDFANTGRLIQYAQFIFNASAFIFLADPCTMGPIFEQLPPALQISLKAAFTLASSGRASDMLNQTIPIYERYHRKPEGSTLPDTPIAIMVSKADLLKYLTVPNRYHFMTKPQYGNTIDLRDMHIVDQETREILGTYQQNDLMVSTSRFERVKFFAASATGEPPDGAGHFANVEPHRCLDPVLWILHQFGVIKAHI